MVRRIEERQRKHTRGPKQRRTEGQNLLTTDIIYLYTSQRSLVISAGWCQFFSALCTFLSPRRHPIFIIGVPSIVRRWQICLKAILLMGSELYDIEKNWQLVACCWKGKKREGGNVEIWRWKDVIYIIISADRAHTYISTHVYNPRWHHDRYL